MITLTQNNYGGPAATLKDYQSIGICVLSGVINIDTTTPEYLVATRLELQLPADFAMIHSAMSSAILYSEAPLYHYGTLLRCWIENNTLCIEKLTPWDSYGSYQIHINSAFVTRGYRGEFSPTMVASITVPDTTYFQFSSYRCVVTDYYVYFVAYFRKFPNPFSNVGPYNLQLNGFPTDVTANIPLIANNSVTVSGQVGSALLIGTLENACYTFTFPSDNVNMGDDNSFLNFFAIRDVV